MFITFPLHVSYCSMMPLLPFWASELCLLSPYTLPLLMFALTMLACLFLRHPPLIILPHISSGVLPHSVSISHPRHHRHPFFRCKLCTSIYAGSCVSREHRECRDRFSTLYLLPVLSTSLPCPSLSPPHTFLPSLLPSCGIADTWGWCTLLALLVSSALCFRVLLC